MSAARRLPLSLALPVLVSLPLLLALLEACAAKTDPAAIGAQASSLIYGYDDRVEPYQLDDRELYELATQSAMAMIPAELVLTDANGAQIDAPPFAERYGLCAGDDRFGDQPSAAVCSGTLVEPDLLLTAGHCTRGNACQAMRFVHGFLYDAPGQLRPLDPRDVYRCKEVVARELSAQDASERLDYAWVRLDRPVPTHVPITFRNGEDEPLSVGEPLIVWGYSGGVPLKVDRGGVVTDLRSAHADYFVFDSDVFVGTSGAGVFDREHRLVAIDGRGGTDFAPTVAGCNAVQRKPAGPTLAQEQATYVTRALAAMCEAQPNSDVCCNAGLHCAATTANGCGIARVHAARGASTAVHSTVLALALGLMAFRCGGRSTPRPVRPRSNRGSRRSCPEAPASR